MNVAEATNYEWPKNKPFCLSEFVRAKKRAQKQKEGEKREEALRLHKQWLADGK
jgi:hypothetical protein